MRSLIRVGFASALTCAAVLSALVPVMGQSPAPPAAPRNYVVIGCIKETPAQAGKTAERTITDYRGGETATFRLDANDSKLTPWVDHMMELHGTIAEPGNAVSKVAPKMNVKDVYEVSRRCTTPS